MVLGSLDELVVEIEVVGVAREARAMVLSDLVVVAEKRVLVQGLMKRVGRDWIIV